MKFFTTPSSKNIIATLRIVTIEISELTFLLILYFHVPWPKKIGKLVEKVKGSFLKNPLKRIP